jgi:hypothetical protein
MNGEIARLTAASPRSCLSEAVLNHVKHLAAQLSRPERAGLAEWLAELPDGQQAGAAAPSMRSLYNLCGDLGSGPSDAETEAK